ncbi:MAG TPA: hypothetical protein VFT84_09625, partial [Gemmatimonadales bacterium]|nr:hypothetical protein [Gemmatimonadales bacterium]
MLGGVVVGGVVVGGADVGGAAGGGAATGGTTWRGAGACWRGAGFDRCAGCTTTVVTGGACGAGGAGVL